MTHEKNKNKLQSPQTPATLRLACLSAGMTVTAAASEAGCARNTAYLAWERPSRYPLAFQKLKKAIQK